MAITRNEFLKCCAAGVCSCVTVLSEAAMAETSNAEIEQLPFATRGGAHSLCQAR